mgnify:CR=1 FL=1|tara:strand:+ start:43846 stop:44451 length:606 start_codon:yes stop_codon:yes gene_type:complete
MSSIEEFVTELTKQKNTSTISNPYLNQDIADNLRLYLGAMIKMEGKRVLLVGEAPGYKGCKITGIPFTSGKAFERFDHPLLKEIGSQLKLTKIESENTATIVWEYLSKKNDTPLFWNSFPFHPHPKDNENKNRAPTSGEVELGINHLKRLHSIYKPEVVAGIGGKGVECAKKAFPKENIVYIRHPSFGGKSEFIDGMDKII